MGWYDGGDELLVEERHVRLGENALVASLAFAVFWANFGLSWYLSTRRVPEFAEFTPAQKADWCSRVPYFINNFISCCAACQFGLLLFLLVELATLPLNVRGFMDAVDRKDSKNYTRSIYVTYVIWGVSRTLLPIFLIYSFWSYSYPSDRNHDVCFFPNLVGAHVIALFCVGVFFFVHTPEIIQLWRTHEGPNAGAEGPMADIDAPLTPEVVDAPTSKSKCGSVRGLPRSLSRPKEPLADDSYDDVELGVMPRKSRSRGDAADGGRDSARAGLHQPAARAGVEPSRYIPAPPTCCSPSVPVFANNCAGYKAPAIENLGVTKLENFPRLRRLRMLLLHNNHVVKIQENLADAVANLEYLMLTGNRIAQLAEVDHLACFAKLDTLTLSGNPVTKRKYYREYVIHKLPQLRVLDFQRIRPHDREAAATLFNSLVGQKIEQEAHGEIATESEVAASTQAMGKRLTHALMCGNGFPHRSQVSIAQQNPPAVSAVPPPPPPPSAAVRVPSPKKQPPAKSPAPKKATKTDAVATSSEMEVEVAPPAAVEETPAPSTPVSKKSVPQVDVEMEDANEEPAAVPYTPSKPIEQMTVAVLREELKKLGLSIKGLKAELVKRLKEAAGGA
ncbi:hypothetical protein BBJ28_00018270 [Nothophytophthora sp. Chile5]|nr:hypothetical protein BBJ28_00018270 [Nothophytophthora sp. Chile5]